MTESTDSITHLSLLLRLKDSPSDTHAWDEFVARYGKMIRRWCRQWGLQEADTEDVTQNVMLALSQQMKTFEYRADGRFRSWLKTIAYRAWCRFLETRRVSRLSIGDDAVIALLESLEAREDFLAELDRECERNLLEGAMELVRGRVETATWNAFRLTALEGQRGVDVSEQLSMSVLAVYRARSRVQAMIQQELDWLETPNFDDAKTDGSGD